MLSSRSHSTFRLLALLLAAFQVLAAGRALVPNLCLTQRDALAAAQDREAAEGVACTGHSCCASMPVTEDDDSTPAPAPGDSGRCAFCFLAKALVEAPDNFTPIPVIEVVSAPCEHGPGRPHRDIPSGLLPGRAPPARA
jgi:hypothetical protein